MSRLRIVAILSFTLILVASTRAEPDPADRAAERWRLVHELEYQDEEIIPLRLKARTAQGAYSTAAQQVIDYARSYYEEYRLEERKLHDLSNQRQFWHEQIPLLQAQLNQARQFTDADRMEALTQELAVAEERLADLVGDWAALQSQLQQMLADLSATDPRLATLRDVRDRHEHEAAEVVQALNDAVRGHPRMSQFDRQVLEQLPPDSTRQSEE